LSHFALRQKDKDYFLSHFALRQKDKDYFLSHFAFLLPIFSACARQAKKFHLTARKMSHLHFLLPISTETKKQN